MNANYWSIVLRQRLSRRRALAASSGAAFGAAFLSACGGARGDKGPRDRSGLLSPLEDESKDAVPGGMYVAPGAPTTGTIDSHANNSTAVFRESFNLYSTPMKQGRAVGKYPAPGAIAGDAFESWEIAPNGLQVTLKLRKDLKFDPRPPTNGRNVTVADVKWSWDRTSALSPPFSEVYNPKNEAGPLQSLSTPDEQTVVIRLAFPYGSIPELLAFWYLFILPREAEDKFNLRSDARGSGPFQLTKWDPNGTGVEYRRNADWYVKGRPLLDTLVKYNLPEYASALAQFEHGAIWTYGTTIRQEDILRLKRDHPELVLRQNVTSTWALPHQIPFILSQREDSPFKDVRLRHAVSMLYDAELFVETFYNVKEFRNAGLPFEMTRDSHISNNGSVNWLDPRSKEFGENAKYFMYNPEEAKKLMAAAGYRGESIDMYTRRDTAAQFNPSSEVFRGMLEAGGFKLSVKPLDPNVEYNNYKAAGYEGYSGMFQNTTQAYNDDAILVTKYTPGGRNHISSKPIPAITDRVIKIQQELDVNRKNEMIKQIQRDLAPLMLDKPLDYDQKPYALHWPWLKNYNVFTSPGWDSDNSSARNNTEYWYDASLHKKPS